MKFENFDSFCDSCIDNGAVLFLEEITDGGDEFWRNRVYAVTQTKEQLVGMWNITLNEGTVYTNPMKNFSTSRRKFKEIK